MKMQLIESFEGLLGRENSNCHGPDIGKKNYQEKKNKVGKW